MGKLKLKAARVQAGLTQADAAKKIGISVTSLSNYETNKKSPKISTLNKICELYKIKVSEVDC